MSDEIRLSLPAQPEYGRIARIAATGVALRCGFDVSELEDLGLAVDETLIALLRPEGAPGRITVTFRPSRDAVEIIATSTAGDGQHWLDGARAKRFAALVADTVDEFELDDEARSVRLLKRHEP